ncbi:hypothetical protein AB205_0006440, partial [Aquarana catesbeiana]
VRRGHSAAVYTSGGRSTTVGHQNKLFRVSHTGAPVDTRDVSMCENCTKKESIPALERGKKRLQLGTLPKKTIVRHFQAMKQCFRFLFLPSNIRVLSIPCFYSHRGETTQDIRGHLGPPTS